MINQIKSLRCGERCLTSGVKTYIMGIVNVTPDSFSDGGKFYDAKAAVLHGLRLIDEGADILDVGGVSTAPGAPPVSEEEELKRVMPVIEGLHRMGITNVSIDTTRARVAKMALDSGASWINDQSAGLADEQMALVMAEADAVVLMHNLTGTRAGVEAGERVIYHDVLAHLSEFFSARIDDLGRQGVDRQKMVVDPGVGFGKGLKDSLRIINNMHRLVGLGAMSLIGLSRKSFLGKLTGIANPCERDFASLGAHAAAIWSGTNIIRTHSVRSTVHMASVLDQCLTTKQAEDKHEDLH